MAKIFGQLKKIITTIISFFQKGVEKHIPAYAAECSYFIIISIAPFALLIFSVLRWFINIEGGSFLRDVAIGVLPSSVSDLLYNIFNEISTKSNFSVISITSLVLIWTASRGIQSLSVGLSNVYNTKNNQGFVKTVLLSVLYTALFIVVLSVTIVVLIFGNRLNKMIFASYPIIQDLLSNVLSFKNVMFILPMTLIFAVFYKLLVKSKIPFSKHFLGAFLASVCWNIFSAGFSIYIDYFADYSGIYGSFTAIVLFMLWLYFCMIIFLYGALINVDYYESKLTVKVISKRIINRIFRRAKNNENEKT